MVKEIYLVDFNYLYNALKKHPSLQNDKNMSEYEQLFSKLQSEVRDYDSLVNAMTALTSFFKDGHTNIEIPYAYSDFCIRILCEWQGDKLILKEKYGSIEAGAEITAIEEMRMEQVLAHAALMIPHENEYLVKSRMVEYPYMNYHIFSEMSLKRLFGRKTYYEVTFKQENGEVTKPCALVRYDGFLDFQDSNFVQYEIMGNRAVLHLDGCVYDDEYKRTLDELARLCKEKNSDILELDLSKNMGGSSAVIDEFIKYVDVDNFRRYEMIDYSSGAPKVIFIVASVICLLTTL